MKTFPKGAIGRDHFLPKLVQHPNVVTPKATIRMTVRGSTVNDLEGIILPAIKEAAQEIAASYGAVLRCIIMSLSLRICVKINSY